MKNGQPAPPDHPWRRQYVGHVRKLEEDQAVEQREEDEKRVEMQWGASLERQANEW